MGGRIRPRVGSGQTFCRQSRVGSGQRFAGSGRVGSGSRKVTRGQLCGLYDVLNSPRQLESVFKQLKSFLLLGDVVPRTRFQSKFKFSHFSHLISIHT